MSQDRVSVPETPSNGCEGDDTRELVHNLEKAVKAVKMYLPNNPQYLHFISRAVENFKMYLAGRTELKLEVRRFDLVHQGESVYHNEDRATSLAFALFKDGIREITINKGAEEAELTAFIQAFNRDFTRDYLDDDIVTYFWEQGFSHIRYLATEEFMDEFLPADIVNAPSRDRAFLERVDFYTLDLKQIKAIITESQSPLNPHRVTMQQSHLLNFDFSLGAQEKERLDNLIKRDSQRQLFPLMVEAILNILRQESDRQSINELLDALFQLIANNLAAGDFKTAKKLIDAMTAMTVKNGGYPAELAAPAKSMLDTLKRDDFIGANLLPAIKDAGDQDTQEITDFISVMPAGAARSLLDLFESVASMKLRKAICRGIAALVKNDVGLIADGLDDARWFVARNTALILGMVKNSQATLYLKRSLRHPDNRVRREVIKAALALDAADIEDYLVEAVNDQDEKLRLLTLKGINRRSGRRIRDMVLNLIDAPAFAKKSDDERRQTFLAFGRVANEGDIARFEAVLNKKHWFRKDLLKEKRWIIEALGAVESPRARVVLAEAASRGPDELRQAAIRALRAPAHPAPLEESETGDA